MAAGILSEYTLKHPVTIECRGLVVLFPEPLNQKAEAVMISNGINYEGFTSTQLSEADFTEDSLILVMEHSQMEKIFEKYENYDNHKTTCDKNISNIEHWKIYKAEIKHIYYISPDYSVNHIANSTCN